MGWRFASEEWVILTLEERIRRCRTMAQEALALAATERESVAADYRQLARDWLALADEMEKVAKGSLR